MTTNLIQAAEQALISLRELHTVNGDCDGAKTCPHATAIRELEAEIARAKLEDDPVFQAVAGMDEHDVANAIIRAGQKAEARFMPGARQCAACAAPIPSTAHADTNLCERCSL